jgi:hypothetical protein
MRAVSIAAGLEIQWLNRDNSTPKAARHCAQTSENNLEQGLRNDNATRPVIGGDMRKQGRLPGHGTRNAPIDICAFIIPR